MATIAQGAVEGDLAGTGLEDVENLLPHDGNVHPRRRLAFGHDFLNILFVFFWLEFFILFLKLFGVRARVANSAGWSSGAGLRRIRGRCRWASKALGR